ncbi:unnamed protein product [Caenorhabditis auriculariae]|uniref:MARVEL domain-containing protein n=1 Tax=Caenorhabditis auriculariae TaxID=2777116 RepID=A0A8S1GR18_9PELO|nr:unnamed protein product [Caenorhabditis auriculariae]
MTSLERPPLIVNKGFLDSRQNLLKIVEVILGVTTACVNNYCYPNPFHSYCTERIFYATQLFSILVINIFCIALTALLAMANLLGFYDAFYKFNFPVLERFLTTLFAVLYLTDVVIIFSDVMSVPFSPAWMLPLIFTLWTAVVYSADAYFLWSKRNYREQW